MQKKVLSAVLMIFLILAFAIPVSAASPKAPPEIVHDGDMSLMCTTCKDHFGRVTFQYRTGPFLVEATGRSYYIYHYTCANCYCYEQQAVVVYIN